MTCQEETMQASFVVFATHVVCCKKIESAHVPSQARPPG